MRTEILLLLLLLLAVTVHANIIALTPPQPTELQIHNDHVVNVFFGNPGKWLRMRIRADTDNIYVFVHPAPYSRSYQSLPLPDEYGQPRMRDTLVLGTTQLRVDVIIGRFPDESQATVEGTQAEGVLGIGARSPLWVLWRNFTKSRDLLALGPLTALHSARISSQRLTAALPPPWAYGVGAASSYVSEFSATMSSHSHTRLRRDCRAALGLVVDDSSEVAEEDSMWAHLLGVQPDESLCSFHTEYRVLFAPNSDYNVIPRGLMLHRVDSPPVFELRSVLNLDEPPLTVVLFNRFDDMYTDIDTTNQAGASVRRMANRVRPGHSNTIIIGEYGLRRFEIAYALDAALSYTSLKHSGLSHAVNKNKAVIDTSIDVRRMQDLWALIAGMLLWALLATEPDPTYPRHSEMDSTQYAHSTTGSLTSPDDPNVVPPGLAAAAEPAPSSGWQSGSIAVVLRRTGDSSRQSVSIAANPDANPTVPQPVDEKHQLAVHTAIRIGAVLRATLRMESQWPVSTETLLYVQALSEAMVAVYFALALGFYDTTWALASVLTHSPSSNTLGWVSLAMIIAAEAVLSLIASLSAGRDARIGSLALQGQILLGLYVLLIALSQWDLALGLLFVIIALLTIVLMVGTLTSCGLVLQYHRRETGLHRYLRAPAIAITLAWLLYITFALCPFVVNRLWDNETQAVLISVFLVLAVAGPVSVYLSFAPFVYPMLPAGEQCARIFNAAQQRWAMLNA